MNSTKKNPPNYYRFIIGGLSGMGASLIVHPIDIIKNRMQMSGEGGSLRVHKSNFNALSNIVKSEGLTSIYKGLSASLLRQATYTLTRLGIYNSLIDHYKKQDGNLSLSKCVVVAAFAGSIAGFVGNPAEVALIRMTTDGRLPINQRFNYHNVFHALYSVTMKEGFSQLFRGVSSTIVRSCILNMVQLSSYTHIKHSVIEKRIMNDNLGCHLFSSFISGILSAFACCPSDVIKTRIQSGVSKSSHYNGIIPTAKLIIQQEGILAFWKGVTAFGLRLGPHTIFTFVFMEQLNRIFIKH